MTDLPPVMRVDDKGRGREKPRLRIRFGMCLLAGSFAFTGVATAPPAAADTADTLKAAVTAARSSACVPYRSDPLIDQAAEAITESTDSYINFTARAVPVTDALPILENLGYGGSKARFLSAAAHSANDSIKAILLQGFAVLPDCSYTDFGASAMYNAKKDVYLMTVVLAA